MARRQFQQALVEELRSFRDKDLRWSYFVTAFFVLVGAIINWRVSHGWAVWPVVFAIGVITMFHEAADRNGQGVPPLHVYAFFIAAAATWLFGAMIVSAVGPVLMIIAPIPLLFIAIRGILRRIADTRLIADRRARKLCVYCGYPINPDNEYCDNCGQEPNPDPNKRPDIRERTAAQKARTRAALSRTSNAQTARANEQKLMDAKVRHSTAKKK